jgi:hypothetical protein
MSTVLKTIQTRMVEAMKAKNVVDKDAYRYIKGQIDLIKESPLSDETAIRKLREILTEAKKNPMFSPREVEILTELVPKELDYDQSLAYLTECDITEQIRTSPREGQAMGVAMKTFAQGKRVVNPNTVRQVVLDIMAGPAPEEEFVIGTA